jgi:hypothetical protein
MADGIDYGVMPFLVPINDGVEMYPGVVCRHVFPKLLRRNCSHFDQIPDTAGRYQPFKPCNNLFRSRITAPVGSFGEVGQIC